MLFAFAQRKCGLEDCLAVDC